MKKLITFILDSKKNTPSRYMEKLVHYGIVFQMKSNFIVTVTTNIFFVLRFVMLHNMPVDVFFDKNIFKSLNKENVWLQLYER